MRTGWRPTYQVAAECLMGKDDEIERLLDEQLDYYRAVAPEYESLSLPGCGGPEVAAALDALAPRGGCLSSPVALGCGLSFFFDMRRVSRVLMDQLRCWTVQRRVSVKREYDYRTQSFCRRTYSDCADSLLRSGFGCLAAPGRSRTSGGGHYRRLIRRSSSTNFNRITSSTVCQAPKR